MSATKSFVASFVDKDDTQTRIRRKSKCKAHLSPLEIAVDDAKRRAHSGEWQGSHGSSYVGLYAMCHHMVYGVYPGELDQLSVFRGATKHAARCLHDDFSDDVSSFAEFVRWSWEREKRLVKWAREKQIDRRRFGWMLQFSRALVTDYRASRVTR